MRWFRIYDDAIDDEKLGLLSDETFRGWFNILCMASKNDGVLPGVRVLAYKLRKTEEQITNLLDELRREHLLDEIETDENGISFTPHNWNQRQFKSDGSTERVKRHRKQQRNVSPPEERNVPETPPESESESEVAVAGDARASGSKVSQEAFELADELLVIAGHSLDFVPPGWCGAAMRVQSWLNSGWTRDAIIPAVKSAAHRKRGPPANSVQFFENAIAEEVARQAAPVPIVEIREAKTITVNGHGTPKTGGSLLASIRRELAEVEKERIDLELSGGTVLGLPDRSVR